MSGAPEDGLPPLRAVIAEAGLSARKELGQHFLLDLNLTRRVARAAGLDEGGAVVEIGPGPGGLTRALFLEGARHVLAIEKDRRFEPALGAIAARYPGALQIAWCDGLEAGEPALLEAAFPGGAIPSGGRVRICANLPYNVATPLIVKWVLAEPWPPWWDSATVMVQREVAERMAAPPGGKTYGRLSVLLALRTEARILFDVAPSAFVPPPKVRSSVVKLTPRTMAPDGREMAMVERVTAAAFGQRRKMLRQSLKGLFRDAEGTLRSIGLEPTARAETLPPEAFLLLARALLG